LTNWYWKFIPGFSAIAKPLSELTKKKVVFRWEEEQEQAYRKLKAALATTPILKQADRTLCYTLRTDASNYALGAALLQAERNYSTTEKEALAIVWAVQTGNRKTRKFKRSSTPSRKEVPKSHPNEHPEDTVTLRLP
jgi:hypothetical protein